MHLLAIAAIFPLLALVLATPFYIAAWLRGSNEDDSPASARPGARSLRRGVRRPRTIALSPAFAGSSSDA